MERRRTIAGSPIRSASETWLALTEIISSSLESSREIDEDAVRAECVAAGPAMCALIANGYLTEDRLTLVASPIYLHLYVATGDKAFNALDDEQIDAVPGGTAASTWAVYVDPPSTLSDLVSTSLAALPHFHASKAPAHAEAAKAASTVLVDLDAFSRMELQ